MLEFVNFLRRQGDDFNPNMKKIALKGCEEKKFLAGVQKTVEVGEGGGVKAKLAMSKHKQIFLGMASLTKTRPMQSVPNSWS